MTSFRLCSVYAAAVAGVLAAGPASAQSGRISASVNIGAQAGSGDFTYRQTPTIYSEPASIDIAQDYENGVLFDIGGGFTVFGNFGVGLAYTHTNGDGVAAVAGQIPHPLFFDQPRAATVAADNLKHSEDAVHLQVFYRFAATPKIDVTVGIGPTFFSVKQQLIDTVSVTEPTPTIAPTVVDVKESPVGVNVGADVTYMITKTFGAGILLRYAGASADFATANGTSVGLDVGGFQFAGGLRVRF